MYPIRDWDDRRNAPNEFCYSTWFKNYYEKVTSDDWPEECRPVEVLQVPGQTVFVPNGWPPLVLNLELTVAVTHNYASEFGPFEWMWKEIKADEPDFAERWCKGMKDKRPDLIRRLTAKMKLWFKIPTVWHYIVDWKSSDSSSILCQEKKLIRNTQISRKYVDFWLLSQLYKQCS